MKEKRYYLNSEFVFRGDLGFSPEFVAYNIVNGELYEVGKEFFKALLLFQKHRNYSEIKKNLELRI